MKIQAIAITVIIAASSLTTGCSTTSGALKQDASNRAAAAVKTVDTHRSAEFNNDADLANRPKQGLAPSASGAKRQEALSIIMDNTVMVLKHDKKVLKKLVGYGKKGK